MCLLSNQNILWYPLFCSITIRVPTELSRWRFRVSFSVGSYWKIIFFHVCRHTLWPILFSSQFLSILVTDFKLGQLNTVRSFPLKNMHSYIDRFTMEKSIAREAVSSRNQTIWVRMNGINGKGINEKPGGCMRPQSINNVCSTIYNNPCILLPVYY